MRATVITDASFCHETKAGGWAAWINGDTGRITAAGAFRRKAPDNVHAEAWAALNGIHIAYEAGAREILLQSDCLAVGDMIRLGRFGYFKMMQTRWEGLNVRYRHVKGHTKTADRRSFCNRWCDKQARDHMRKKRHEIATAGLSDTGPTSALGPDT